MKKWLDNYKKGGYIPNYVDGTKYPQIGPRDWMNKHGWYAKEGGPYTQWGDIAPIANSSNPQYQDYGSMYSADPRFGLMYKPENIQDWGMGNTANLIHPNYTGFSGGTQPIQQPLPIPTPGISRQQSANSHTNEDTDYSIDSVRMKKGGSTNKQNSSVPVNNQLDMGSPMTRLEALHYKYPTADRTVLGDQYQDNIGPIIERTEGLTGQGFANLISGRYGEDVDNFYSPHTVPNNYQIDARTMSPIVPEQYRDYSRLNKPQFDYIQGSQQDDEVYKDGGRINKTLLRKKYEEGKLTGKLIDIGPREMKVLGETGLREIDTPFWDRVNIANPTFLPIDNTPQQMQPMQLPDFREDEWRSLTVVNGKLVQPAGMYKKGPKQFKKGGKIEFTNQKTALASGDTKKIPLTKAQQEDIDKQQQIEDIQRRQANTPAIGGKPNQRTVMQNVRRTMSDAVGKLPQPFGMVGSALTDFSSYPAQAAVNLLTPQQYNWKSPDMALTDMGLDALAITPLLPKFRRPIPRVYGESNVAAHDPYSSIQSIPREPVNISNSFPLKTIKGKKGNTGMPTITEGRDPRTLTKNEQILKGYGIEPKENQYGGPIMQQGGWLAKFK